MNESFAGWGMGVLAAVATVALCGCANGIPKGTLSYYLPKAETTITITQTLTCTAGNELLQVVTVSPSTVYSSDLSRVEHIEPSNISGFFSDADISFKFTNDGRLSGVNTATTGQGGTIVKNVLAVAKAAGATLAAATSIDSKTACETIANLAPKSTKADAPAPSLTLNYARTFGYDTSSGKVVRKVSDDRPKGQEKEFDTEFSGHTLYKALLPSIPQLGFDFDIVSTKGAQAVQWAAKPEPKLVVKVNSLVSVNLEVRGLKGDMAGNNREPMWTGEVLVPMTHDDALIKIPIPKAAFFGQRKFSLELADSGAITKIGYVSTGMSETADAWGAIGSAIGASSKNATVAQQASALQAQADLIFQQQRLANCQVKPESCTK